MLLLTGKLAYSALSLEIGGLQLPLGAAHLILGVNQHNLVVVHEDSEVKLTLILLISKDFHHWPL